MNKTFLWIFLAVVILGLLLILLNTRMGQPHDPAGDSGVTAPVSQTPSSPQPAPPVTSATPDTPIDGDRLAAAGVKPSPAAVERGFAFETDEGAATETAAVPPTAASHGTTDTPAATAPSGETAKAEPPAARPQPAAKPQTRKAAPAPRVQIITNFVVYVREGGATIRLDAASPILFKYLELASPARVVVDLIGPWKISEPGVPKGEVVKDVRLGKKGNDTRIVIDLHTKARARYIRTRGKTRLDIRLDKAK